MPEQLDFAELGEAIGNATAVLRSNAASAGLDTPVPARPGWTMRDLVLDQGVVHRQTSSELQGNEVPALDDLVGQATSATDLLEWLDDGMVDLLNALAAAPEDRQAWFRTGSASANQHATARWLCHDATAHAVLAMTTRLGRAPSVAEVWFSPALARDGLDWLGEPDDAAGDPSAAYLARLLSGTG